MIVLKVFIGWIALNFVLTLISYVISKYTSDPASANLQRGDTIFLLILGGVMFFGFYSFKWIQERFFTGASPFQSMFAKLDYYFDPKLKSKRIMDKQIADFQRGIKR